MSTKAIIEKIKLPIDGKENFLKVMNEDPKPLKLGKKIKIEVK